MTLKGRVEEGNIILIDDVIIPDGCLVDVTIVQTPEQSRLAAAASKRTATEQPLRMKLKGGQYTADPVELFGNQKFLKKASFQFEGFDTKAESSFERFQEVIIEVILKETSPPDWLRRSVNKLVKDRFNMSFNPKAKAGQLALRELAAKIESVDGAGECQVTLWHQVLSLLASDGRAIPEAIQQAEEMIGLWSVEQSEYAEKPPGTKAGEISEATQERVRQELREGFVNAIKETLVVHRRSGLHDKSATTKMRRKEVAEILKSLDRLS